MSIATMHDTFLCRLGENEIYLHGYEYSRKHCCYYIWLCKKKHWKPNNNIYITHVRTWRTPEGKTASEITNYITGVIKHDYNVNNL